MNDFSHQIIKNTSIPLPGGGDTHIHPFGQNPNDFTITTRIPVGGGSVGIHNNPLDPGNPNTNSFNWKP